MSAELITMPPILYSNDPHRCSSNKKYLFLKQNISPRRCVNKINKVFPSQKNYNHPSHLPSYGFVQRQMPRAVADLDFILARRHQPAVLCLVKIGERMAIQFHCHGLFSAGRQENFLETFEFMHRPLQIAGWRGDIDLRHLGTSPRARIGHIEADFHYVTGSGDFELIEGKGCVAKAETERKLRLNLDRKSKSLNSSHA